MQFESYEAYAAVTGTPVQVTPEPQDSDYESGSAVIDGEVWHIRTARTTPTKLGAFVAFWRRDDAGETAPFPSTDASAGLLVFVTQGAHRGVFRFTLERLAELGITSAPERAGKRGFRVYPSWCTELNPQATRTQRGQASAFQLY